MATAPSARTESGRDAPAHIIPDLDNETVGTFVYLWPSDSDGNAIGTAPALSSSTASRFIKAWYDGSGTIQVRGTQVVSYIESDGKFWLRGDYTDRPLYTNEMSVQSTTSPNIKDGWHWMVDSANDLHLPSVDADDDGDIFDVNPTGTGAVDLRDRAPWGASGPPQPIDVSEVEVVIQSNGAPSTQVLKVFFTWFIGRVN